MTRKENKLFSLVKIPSYWCLLLLISPLLTAIWWGVDTQYPTTDSLGFFMTANHLSQALENSGLLGFLDSLSHHEKPLMPTILAAPLILIFGVKFHLVVGIINTALMLILSLSLFTIFRLFYSHRESALAALTICSLTWMNHQSTIFEAQMALVSFGILFIAAAIKFQKSPTTFWAVVMGASAAGSILARPVEAAIFLILIVVPLSAKYRTLLSRKYFNNLIFATIIFFYITIPWVYYAYSSLEKWIKQAVGPQTVGPFVLKSPDLLGLASSFIRDFLGITGLVILVFGLVLFIQKYRNGTTFKKDNNFILKILICISLVVPISIFIFVGAKNPVYFYLNYLCFYLFLFISFSSIKKWKNQLMCLILPCLIIWNIVLSGAIVDVDKVVTFNEFILSGSITRSRPPQKHSPAITLVKSVSEIISSGSLKNERVATILLLLPSRHWFQTDTLNLAADGLGLAQKFNFCAKLWMMDEKLYYSDKICGLHKENYLLIGPKHKDLLNFQIINPNLRILLTTWMGGNAPSGFQRAATIKIPHGPLNLEFDLFVRKNLGNYYIKRVNSN